MADPWVVGGSATEGRRMTSREELVEHVGGEREAALIEEAAGLARAALMMFVSQKSLRSEAHFHLERARLMARDDRYAAASVDREVAMAQVYATLATCFPPPGRD